MDLEKMKELHEVAGRLRNNFVNHYRHKRGHVVKNMWCASKPILNTCLCICLFDL